MSDSDDMIDDDDNDEERTICHLCNYHLTKNLCELCIENMMEAGCTREDAVEAYLAMSDDCDEDERVEAWRTAGGHILVEVKS